MSRFVRHKLLQILCMVFLAGAGQQTARAQTFPFRVNPIVQPPYSTLLSDYLSPAGEKLVVNVAFNDFNEPSWEFYLRVSIQSSRMSLRTRPDFRPAAPFTIVPGTPLRLTAADLSQYLDLNNMQISGMSADELRRTDRLPDGLYSFCFEVIDYRSNQVLSRAGCYDAWLMTIDEPTPILPVCGTSVKPIEPQNVQFQWQLTNGTAAIQANTEYVLRVYEVTDPQADPMLAINNGKAIPIFESEPIAGRTSYNYNISAPPLELAKRYVWTVQATDRDGRNLFKNNGISQVCWFRYGYPEGGRIALQKPDNQHAFGKNDLLKFAWSLPDNLVAGQAVRYKFRAIELLPGQDAASAVAVNPAWFEEETAETPAAGSSWEYILRGQRPESGKAYAWHVLAYSGEQEIAKSNALIFNGPPVVEKFLAGKHEVTVISTSNADLSKLSGRGSIKINLAGDSEEFDFKDIKLENIAGRMVLASGEIVHPLKWERIELTPALPENGAAYFYPQNLILTKDFLQIEGETKWALPHPVTSGKAAEVLFAKARFGYDDFKLLGSTAAAENNRFELAEPYRFRLNLAVSSRIIINQDNRYELQMDGDLLLPENKFKAPTDESLSVRFVQAAQLFYLENNLTFDRPLAAVPGTLMQLLPQKLVVDLSEEKSAGIHADNPAWKGIYLESYRLQIPQKFDGSNQFYFPRAWETDLQSLPESHAFLTGGGLTLRFQRDFNNELPALFNTFGGNLRGLQLNVEDNVLTKSTLRGFIRIPLLAGDQELNYTADITSQGIQPGHMEEDLTGRYFAFNPDGGDQRVEMQIARAAFADNERLELTLDAEWRSLELTMPGLQHLRLWGDGRIGFGIPNGQVALTNQVKGKLPSGNEIRVTHVMAANLAGQYAFGVRAEIVMMANATGKEGVPTADFISAMDFKEMLARANTGISDSDRERAREIPPRTSGMPPDRLDPRPTAGISGNSASVPAVFRGGMFKQTDADGKIVMDSMYMRVAVPLLFSMEGMLKLYYGHQIYGDAFMGALDGKMELPFAIQLYGLAIAGAKDKYPFGLIQFGAAVGGKVESRAAVAPLMDAALADFQRESAIAEQLEEKYGVPLSSEDIKQLMQKELEEILARKVKTDDELIFIKRMDDRSGTLEKRLTEHEQRRLALLWANLVKTSDDIALRGELELTVKAYLKAKAGAAAKAVGNVALEGAKWVAGKIYFKVTGNQLFPVKPSPKGNSLFDAGQNVANAAKNAGNNANGGKSTKAKVMEMLSKGIPVVPKVLFLTGMEGVFYFGMKRSSFEDIGEDISMHSLTFVPDPDNWFGMMLRAQFSDMPTSGMIAQFGGMIELSLNGGRFDRPVSGDSRLGYIIGMKIFGKVGNVGLPGMFTYSVAAIDGKAVISVPDTRIRLEANAMFNAPVVCGQNNFAIDLSPQHVRLNIGSRERPAYMMPMCLGVAMTGFLDINEKEFEVGVGFKAGIDLQLPWIGIREVAAIRPYLSAYLQAMASTRVIFQPELGLDNIRLSATARAAVGVEWELVVVGKGNLRLVDVIFQGDLIARFKNEISVSGKLRGKVHVVGIDFDIETQQFTHKIQ
ncbi:hypothetical protein [Rhodoflexus caldus]|uniref:hypothetical protein n=1 Tax=Rhodoflexus caldus TaxID=2891236 RepID=UPI00202A6FD8|nr:hypothetical protein [Rhodoflexus caldus]